MEIGGMGDSDPRPATQQSAPSRAETHGSGKVKFALDTDENHTTLLQQDPHYALVYELIATEQEFVADLEICFAFVVRPLLEAPELTPGSSKGRPTHSRGPSLAELARVSEEDIKDIQDCLGMIQPLYTQNLVLLTKMIEKASSRNWSNASHINGLFANNSSAFLLYVSYTQAYVRIEPLFTKISAVVQSIDQQSVLLEKNTKDKVYTVKSLLKSPTMRIAQYMWYFQQLVSVGATKYTLSLGEMQKYNSAIANIESKDKFARLEARFDGGKVALTKEGRVLVKEGILTRVTRRGMRAFYFHLFNDLLLYSNVLKNGMYNLRQSFELQFVSVAEPAESSPPFALQINTPQKSFVVVCESKEDKLSWEDTLTKCLAEQQPGERGSFTAPVWAQDRSATCCALCQTGFTAIKRRHHCRACGVLVCGQCSKARLLLPVDKKAVRVCDSCKNNAANPAS